MNHIQACEILGVEAVADLESVRQHYRLLASRCHPDRFLTAAEKAEATERFQEIAEAFLVLRKHAGDTDEQVDLDAAAPPDDAAESPAAPTWTSWAAEAAKNAPPSFGKEELDQRRGFAWARYLPPLISSPNMEVILDLVLLPSHLAGALTRLLTKVARVQFGAAEDVAGLGGTLAGHLIPAILGLAVGYLMIDSPVGRGLAAIAFGCWWVTSGVLSAIHDPEVIPQPAPQEPRPR